MKRITKVILTGLILMMLLATVGQGVSHAQYYNRNNPAPIGVKQTISVDNYFGNYTMEITVTEAIRGEEAWTRIYDANMYNDVPGYDEEYILAKIKVKLLYSEGGKRIDVSPVHFSLYSSSNVEYSGFYSVVPPEPDLRTSLYQGGEHEGYVGFLVKKSDRNPKIVFGENYDGTGGVWFKFTKDGTVNKGWVKEGGKWYYYKDNGTMQKGWLLNGGKWYFLDNNGVMQTGWTYSGGNWYYLSNSGVMRTGWLLDGGSWYYLSPSGSMRTGWLFDSGNWYYLNNSGQMQTGWLWNGGNWWYLYNNGAMAKNVAIGGYRLGNNGAMIR